MERNSRSTEQNPVLLRSWPQPTAREAPHTSPETRTKWRLNEDGSKLRLSALSFPPKHPFQTSAVRVRPGHPLLNQREMRRKPLQNFFSRRPKRGPVLI